MPDLREALTHAGFAKVRTYIQSGNVILSSRMKPENVATRCREVIAEEFGLDVPIVVVSRDELAEVVRANPLSEVADDPKRLQVTFLERELEPGAMEAVEAAAAGRERVVVRGRAVYAWHPDGIQRSKLAGLLGGTRLGTVASSRNWTTLTTLLEMADGH